MAAAYSTEKKAIPTVPTIFRRSVRGIAQRRNNPSGGNNKVASRKARPVRQKVCPPTMLSQRWVCMAQGFPCLGPRIRALLNHLDTIDEYFGNPIRIVMGIIECSGVQ